MKRRTLLRAGLSAAALPLLPGYVRAADLEVGSGVRFLRRDDHTYDNYVGLFNKRLSFRPKVIAVCDSEAGVQQAVLTARRLGLPLAVRSGGHSFEGFCMNDDGMVIHLVGMHSQQLHPDNTFSAGPGTILLQQYDYLLPRGRLLPTGSCGMVGLGGITLGGGYGLFAREHGLSCDHLIAARMVDGAGEVHEVTEGSELLWALRGGGNGNFGVVTELRFNTVAAPERLWSYRFRADGLSPARAARLAEQWFAIAARLPRECFAAFVLNGSRLNLLVTSTQPEASSELRELLTELQGLTDKRYSDLHPPITEAVKRYYGRLQPLYFRNASAGFYHGFDDIAPVAEAVFRTVAENRGTLFQINTVGGAINDPQRAGASAYAHRSANFLAEVQSYWEHPEQQPTMMAAVAHIQSLLRDAGIIRHYRNYPDAGFDDWANAYWGGHYSRLQRIKGRYDPDDLFHHPQSVRLTGGTGAA